MYLPHPITGEAGPHELQFVPGTPIFRWETTGAEGKNLQPGRMTLSFRMASDWFFSRNGDGAHQVNMLRASLGPTFPDREDSGKYRGHGAIFGHILNRDGDTFPAATGMLESWGPHYGIPGGNYIPADSRSLPLAEITLYDVEISSLWSASNHKFSSLSITPPGRRPVFQTGDVLDDNPDVDMTSESLAMCGIFRPLGDGGMFRMINPSVVWTADATPRLDLRHTYQAPA